MDTTLAPSASQEAGDEASTAPWGGDEASSALRPRAFGPPQAIRRVRYTHDAMIDLIVANPGVPQGMLAAHFGYTQAWVSRVMSSDAFKARLEQRRAELVDPMIVASVEERFEGLVRRSLDVVMEKLDAGGSGDFALRALEVGSKAMGYGARANGPGINLQQNFVVAMPQKSVDAGSWTEAYAPLVGERARVAEIKEALLAPPALGLGCQPPVESPPALALAEKPPAESGE